MLNKPVLRVAAEDLALTSGASRRPVPRNLTDSELPESPALVAPLVVISGGSSQVQRMTSSQPCELRSLRSSQAADKEGRESRMTDRPR